MCIIILNLVHIDMEIELFYYFSSAFPRVWWTVRVWGYDRIRMKYSVVVKTKVQNYLNIFFCKRCYIDFPSLWNWDSLFRLKKIIVYENVDEVKNYWRKNEIIFYKMNGSCHFELLPFIFTGDKICLCIYPSAHVHVRIESCNEVSCKRKF